MHGSHLLQHWSSTQSVVALSSAEAELNAIVKAMMELKGVLNMCEEFGKKMKGQVLTDSSAANGVVHRQGSGKVKHLECHQLWIQGAVARGEVSCVKIPRERNPADMLTHYWSKADGSKHLRKLGVEEVKDSRTVNR